MPRPKIPEILSIDEVLGQLIADAGIDEVLAVLAMRVEDDELKLRLMEIARELGEVATETQPAKASA